VEFRDAPIWREFDKFLARETPLDEFEAWVYQSPELERVLESGEYLTLVELDYRGPHALHEANKVASAIYDAHRPGLLAQDRAERLARGMLAGEINIAAGSRALARLYHEDHEWIPIAFVGIASEFDDMPTSREYPLWDPRSLAQRLTKHRDMERHYRAPALVAARRLLERLAEIAPRGA
jgi:hypothetical protein